MIFTKDKPIEVIDIALNEVKTAMETTNKSTVILDDKADSMIKISISIIFGSCAILFTSLFTSNKDIINLIIPSIIIILGNAITLFMLYKAYKTSQYYLYGDQMINIHQADNYYHDCIGIKIYLIDQYQIKVNGNLELNKTKGKYINWAISAIMLSGILGCVSFLFISLCKI